MYHACDYPYHYCLNTFWHLHPNLITFQHLFFFFTLVTFNILDTTFMATSHSIN